MLASLNGERKAMRVSDNKKRGILKIPQGANAQVMLQLNIRWAEGL